MNIDREIAEKVMGWRLAQSNLKKPYWKDKLGNYCCLSDNWTPSTNSKQALEVEAAMLKRGFYISIHRRMSGEDFGVNFCDSMAFTAGKGFALLLPESICLAALDALK